MGGIILLANQPRVGQRWQAQGQIMHIIRVTLLTTPQPEITNALVHVSPNEPWIGL